MENLNWCVSFAALQANKSHHLLLNNALVNRNNAATINNLIAWLKSIPAGVFCCDPRRNCQIWTSDWLFFHARRRAVKSWTAEISAGVGDVPEVSVDQNLSDNSVKAQHCHVRRSHVSKTVICLHCMKLCAQKMIRSMYVKSRRLIHYVIV